MSQSLQVKRIQFAACLDALLWRALSFARNQDKHSPWMAAQLRRMILLFWWTATFQLHTHARYWLRARRLRRTARPPVTPMPVLDTIDPRKLFIPFSAEPLVSIIIPTYGQVSFTLRCLASISQYAPALPIEVIVVDDAWPDADARELHLVHGIRLIRNEINVGFLYSCNRAAVAANGQYLCFLNNDTQVLDGWLEPMVTLFQQRPDTGAVGAKLLYPDGRLQEAGGIIWRDASGWNFGRREDPSNPVYNYVREVDYCSGAALMVERTVFSRLGGFDERYAPAYFEDSDLCFRLRRIGLKTLYQPASRVMHHEGVSHGRDTAVGIKSYQVANRRTFISVWAHVLATEHYPNGENVFRARDRAMHRKVALIIDHYVPTPDRDAGSRTIRAFIDALLQADYVVKFWPHNLCYTPGYTEALQARGVEVFHGAAQPSFETWIKTNGPELDLALVSRPDVAEHAIPPVRRYSRAALVYYGHDLHFRRMRHQAEVANDGRLARLAEQMLQRESAIWRLADRSLYPSEEEAQIATSFQPGARVGSVIPYSFDTFANPRMAPNSQEIIFVAGFGHPPNEDAAIWFLHDILPLILAAVPHARLSIIGSNPSARVTALATSGITVQANVSEAELAAAYERARVAVMPLRSGAGVKLKTVEALRSGVPLVTTWVGAQGLPGLAEIVPVRDDPRTFADAVILLLLNDATWERQCYAQISYAEARFSRSAFSMSLLSAIAVRR